jgi:hypothetical protein
MQSRIVGFLTVLAAIAASIFYVVSGTSVSEFAPLIQAIRTGAIVEGAQGELQPPASLFSKKCFDNSVYVTRRPDGTFAVFIPMWRGKGRNAEGFLFDSGGTSTPGKTINVVGPEIETAYTAKIVTYDVERVIDGSWRYISFRLD